MSTEPVGFAEELNVKSERSVKFWVKQLEGWHCLLTKWERPGDMQIFEERGTDATFSALEMLSLRSLLVI